MPVSLSSYKTYLESFDFSKKPHKSTLHNLWECDIFSNNFSLARFSRSSVRVCVWQKRRQQWQKYSVYCQVMRSNFSHIPIHFPPILECFQFVGSFFLLLCVCVFLCWLVYLKSFNLYCVSVYVYGLFLSIRYFVTYVLYSGNKIWNLDYNHSNSLSS